MNDSITRISLDVHDAGSSVNIHAKRGDTGRVIIISLVDGGVPYVITKDCTAVFTGKKPDGNVLYNDCTISQNTIIYAFTDNTVAAAGRINCEIKLYGADGKLITSPKFTINVQDTVYNEGDEIESTDEFNALTVLVTEATEAIQNANQVAEDLEEARDNGEFNGPPGEPGAPGSALIDDSAVRKDAAWSSKNILDKLCPSIKETGELIQCEPVEGYPLKVTGSFEGTLEVSVCGKNLYNETEYPMVSNNIIRYSSGSYLYSATFAATEKYIPVEHLRGQRISIRNSPYVTAAINTNAGVAFYDADKVYITGFNTVTMEVPTNATYMRFSIKNEDVKKGVQFELGSASTDYEPYVFSNGVAADTGELPVIINAHKGVNTIWAIDEGGTNLPATITVAGKADPATIIEKLTNAIIGLGANI